MTDPYDRTRRYGQRIPLDLGRLADVRIVLEIGPDAANDPAACQAYLAAVNMATRLTVWCPTLHVKAPATKHRGRPLNEQALAVVRAGVRAGDFDRNNADHQPYDLCLSIGTPTVQAKHHIAIGWNNGVATATGVKFTPSPAPRSTRHPFTYLLAAALGVARLHGWVINQLVPGAADIATELALNPFTLDTTFFEPDPAGLRVEDVAFIGAGAIADALAYALAHLPTFSINGEVIDPDTIDVTKHNRHLTLTYEEAEEERIVKAVHLAGLLGCAARPRLYEEWRKAGQPPKLAIVTVDNADVRRAVAQDLPHIILDASTGGTGMAIMRGERPNRSCVGCAYPRVVEDEAVVWARRLGLEVDLVRSLQAGTRVVDDEILAAIRENGAMQLTIEDEARLRGSGWKVLNEVGCAKATVDKRLPGASISYLSVAAGVVLAAQLQLEGSGTPILVGDRRRWAWDDLFKPGTANWSPPFGDDSCEQRHELTSEIYAERWAGHHADAAHPLPVPRNPEGTGGEMQ